ncbi:MAG: cytochrome c5 family protein [Gammaproteobacteria bacterium]|nr:cytochrome c5 family protein [Gammaproteobacteria bacterium]
MSTVSHQDKSLFTTFAAVLGFLVVLAFVFYFVAQTAVGNKDAAGDNSQATQTADENIKPVGNVVVAGESSAGAASAGPRSGADVFNGFCMACHGTGAAGAPKVGDKAAWKPRFAQGMDTLLNHAVNGIRAMPPKGTCGDCSDDELKGAIAHMLNETGFKVKVDAAAPVAAAAPAAADGKKIYDTTCMACHATGAAGAPKVGDKAAWAPRIAQGMDTLAQHAVAGIRAMPPRGTCAACSDDDLKAAMEYMVGESK